MKDDYFISCRSGDDQGVAGAFRRWMREEDQPPPESIPIPLSGPDEVGAQRVSKACAAWDERIWMELRDSRTVIAIWTPMPMLLSWSRQEFRAFRHAPAASCALPDASLHSRAFPSYPFLAELLGDAARLQRLRASARKHATDMAEEDFGSRSLSFLCRTIGSLLTNRAYMRRHHPLYLRHFGGAPPCKELGFGCDVDAFSGFETLKRHEAPSRQNSRSAIVLRGGGGAGKSLLIWQYARTLERFSEAIEPPEAFLSSGYSTAQRSDFLLHDFKSLLAKIEILTVNGRLLHPPLAQVNGLMEAERKPERDRQSRLLGKLGSLGLGDAATALFQLCKQTASDFAEVARTIGETAGPGQADTQDDNSTAHDRDRFLRPGLAASRRRAHYDFGRRPPAERHRRTVETVRKTRPVLALRPKQRSENVVYLDERLARRSNALERVGAPLSREFRLNAFERRWLAGRARQTRLKLSTHPHMEAFTGSARPRATGRILEFPSARPSPGARPKDDDCDET